MSSVGGRAVLSNLNCTGTRRSSLTDGAELDPEFLALKLRTCPKSTAPAEPSRGWIRVCSRRETRPDWPTTPSRQVPSSPLPSHMGSLPSSWRFGTSRPPLSWKRSSWTWVGQLLPVGGRAVTHTERSVVLTLSYGAALAYFITMVTCKSLYCPPGRDTPVHPSAHELTWMARQ